MKNNGDDIGGVPFLRVLPFVIAGIVAANLVHIPLAVSVPLGIACMVVCFLGTHRQWGQIALCILLFACAATMAEFRTTRAVVPQGRKIMVSLTVEENPVIKGRWQRCSAQAEDYCEDDAEEWHNANERVMAYIDTCFHVSAGDRLVAVTYFNPISADSLSGYAKLMWRRGYTAKCYVTSRLPVVELPRKAHGLRIAAAHMQKKATDRFDRLTLSSSTEATCKAMTFGDKRGLDSELKEDYSLSGTAHLLAVSGLHVGIVAMLVNALLVLVPFLRYGHIIKNIVAIVMILLYAMMAGLSPSVIRAAIMFCGFQIAMATSQKSNRINIMVATATVMLVFNPNYLYDISFQLSFLAVAGIMVMYAPLYRYFKCRYKILNMLTGVVIVGLAATFFTAPAVSAQFGRVSLVGIFINPIVLITANIIVLISLAYTIFPIGFLTVPVEKVLEFAAGLQNRLVSFSGSLPWASLNFRLPQWAAITIYVLLAVALLAVVVRNSNTKQSTSKLKPRES